MVMFVSWRVNVKTTRCIIGLLSLCPYPSFQHLNSQLYKHQTFHLSSLSRSSKPSHWNRNKEPNLKQDETESINSLFQEIADILGTDVRDTASSEISKETHLTEEELFEQLKDSAPTVCENVELNKGLIQEEIPSTRKETPIRDTVEIDVSPIVHEITGIVRAKNGAFSMEDRLEGLSFQFEPDVVENVLKRCFKVPHLAFGFFNWVKKKDGFCHTTQIYNTMLYIAGEAKDFGLVDNLVEEMDKNSCEKDIKTWTILISQYGKAKLIGKALLLFEKMRKSAQEPDLKTYKMLLRSLCNVGKGEVAWELYKEMIQKSIAPDLSLSKMLLNCMAKLGDVDAIKFVSESMVGVSKIPEREVHLCVLKSFCVAGRIKDALELIRELKNKQTPIDKEFFKTLLKGLVKANRITDASDMVEIMRKMNIVDEKVYGIMINGYLRRKEIPKALDLFENMRQCGYLPTTSTYTELMQQLFHASQYDKGCQLFNEMLERGAEMDSVAVMSTVIGHIHQSHISEAWKVFKAMEDRGIKLTWKQYFILIKELCKVSKSDEIWKVFHHMQASGTFIHQAIFKWAISFMEKRGDMDNIKKLKQMQDMCKFHFCDSKASNSDVPVELEPHKESIQYKPKQEKMESHLFKPLSKACNQQDLHEVCRILSSSEEWNLIQEALEESAIQFKPEVVVEIMRNSRMHSNMALHFFSWIGKRSGYFHTSETYNMAIKLSGCGKDFRHMRDLFYEMRRKGSLLTPDTWAIMIMQYGRAGLTDIALKFFHEMKASGFNPTTSTYKFLIVSLCGRKGRKTVEAIKIFQEMIQAGHIPDKELVETYLLCLSESCKLLEARRCMETLQKVGFTRTHSYSMYFRALCRAGSLEEALSLIDKVMAEQPALAQYTYGSLMHALLRQGRLEEALSKMEAMKQAGFRPTVHAYTSLIVYFFKERQTEKALEILLKMRDEGHEPTIVTYSALIRGYMNVGNVAEAWKVFHSLKLKGPMPDFKTYSMFISCLCKIGKSEEAMQLLNEMMDNGIVPSNINYRTIFFGLNREGKRTLAQTVLQQKSALKRKRKFLTL
ncbi:hypothetical protein K2173_005674 [Erythroxylum novogranatense]|uniref:Pentatricopeptide repeat-containing protein n=1 Tax=Erythroxylum novogranatense TaxID=1862640 RepID=A0AAV8SQN2_9ROSI|nr:hypothetical protein K2173_005674 [Erythroxylum novogranatense]